MRNRPGGRPAQRSRKADGYGGRLRRGQLGGSTAEIDSRRGTDSVDALAHLRHVQIDFKYSPLTPHLFNQEGPICLKGWADHCMRSPGKDILRGLLGYCTASAQGPAILEMLISHFIQCLPRKTVMGEEFVIFGSQHRPGSIQRNL